MTSYLPPGISEADFVNIVNKVALSSSIKYKFGYHEVSDLQQRSFELAINFMGYNVSLNPPSEGRHIIYITKNLNRLHFLIYNNDGVVIWNGPIKHHRKSINVLKRILQPLWAGEIDYYSRNVINTLVAEMTGLTEIGCKFKPRGDKPLAQQLTNFLRVWIHNRLSNDRRNNSCRYPNKGGSNQTKYNLMHPIRIHSQGLTNSEIFARGNDVVDELSRRETLEKLINNLKKSELSLYYKYINEVELSPVQTAKLFNAVKRIFNHA